MIIVNKLTLEKFFSPIHVDFTYKIQLTTPKRRVSVDENMEIPLENFGIYKWNKNDCRYSDIERNMVTSTFIACDLCWQVFFSFIGMLSME